MSTIEVHVLVSPTQVRRLDLLLVVACTILHNAEDQSFRNQPNITLM
jgi:hypothetical protein